VKTAERLERIKPFRVMEILDRAHQLEREGVSVLHMEVGEPDFSVAEQIRMAGVAALQRGQTRYTSATGLPELRQAISGYYDRFGIDVDPDRIVITSGASGGLMLLAAALLDPGDQMLVTDPGYPCNEVFAQSVGASVIRVPVSAGTGFQPEWTDIEAAWKGAVKGVLLASPANPTGTMVRRATLAHLARSLPDSAFLIVDEIYQGLTGKQSEYPTALAVSSRPIVLQSFSKYFGMTGWRLGWIVVPDDLVDGIKRLAQNLFICPPTVSQYAAIAALSAPALQEHDRRSSIFRDRLTRMTDGLEAMGLNVPVRPDGAFYLYVDITSSGLSASEFSRRLLDEFHIAATPGTDFGEHEAERHVRFACTVELDVIDEVLRRLRLAMDQFRAS
jgi:aspartate/methionine/tyrosine aminotransferase